jgi:hypothetical protein
VPNYLFFSVANSLKKFKKILNSLLQNNVLGPVSNYYLGFCKTELTGSSYLFDRVACSTVAVCD